MVARAHHKFEMQGKKVMIVDNCPAHLETSGLKAINLQFLPQNTNSCIYTTDGSGDNQVCFLYYLLILLTKSIESQSNV